MRFNFVLLLFAVTCVGNIQSKTISLDSLLRGPAMTEIVIKKVNNEEVKLFYIKPADTKATKNRTAVVWIHGGGWTGGITETFFPHARYFASRGTVGFCIHYRLVKADGSATVADCLADCKSAIRYIREHAEELGIDPDKIIVMGDSAGGHLASCLGTIDGFDDPTENLKISAIPNAMVLYNPLSDFTTSPFINRIIGGAALDKKPTPESQIPNSKQIELARKLSPLYNVHKNQPPTLVLHGTDDTVILPEQSVQFTEAMKKAGNKCKLILIPNTKHAFVCVKWKAPEVEVVSAIREADKFLIKMGFLKAKPTLVPSKNPAWIPIGATK
ncbi:MAG: alpha/beta hydrolase [Paludibacter sp.]